MNRSIDCENGVLVISTGVDASTDEVMALLETRGVRVSRLDTELFPYRTEFTAAFTDDSPFTLSIAGEGNLERARSVWYRRVRTPAIWDGMNPGVHEFCLREARAALLGSILSLDCPVMSRPDLVWAAENKPFQLKVASELGLEIPRTVITNSPEKVREAFRFFDGAMIAKPVRTGYVDLGDDQLAIFTSRVLEEHLQDSRSLSVSPVIYQQHIEKRSDIRVTIVGRRLFAAEIDSQLDPEAIVDWRQTVDPGLPHRKIELPIDLQRLLLSLMDRLNLQYGAIDLVRTPDDRFVFLEINPNGQWLWLDDKLNLGITDAVAAWLIQERE